MKQAQAQAAADLLTECWQTGATVPAFPPECRPRTAAEGYRIQDLLAKALRLPIGGWKIGCTGAAARRILRSRGPFAGRIFAPRIFRSGVVVPAEAYRLRGLEGEFAFELKRDLPARKRAYTVAEVTEAVGALYPAIEIVESRFADWLKVGVPSLIADQGSNGALVLGKPVPRWQSLDLGRHPVRMIVSGRTVGAGSGADCLGHPLKALAWLANLCRTRNGLAAGQIISTGTCTGFHRADPGDDVVADFGRMGRVRLSIMN